MRRRKIINIQSDHVFHLTEPMASSTGEITICQPGVHALCHVCAAGYHQLKISSFFPENIIQLFQKIGTKTKRSLPFKENLHMVHPRSLMVKREIDVAEKFETSLPIAVPPRDSDS